MFLENEYYPQYRDTSLMYFRFVEICEKAKLCLGHVLIKGRRAGVSSMEASIELLNGLIHRNQAFGRDKAEDKQARQREKSNRRESPKIHRAYTRV